jgi:uncharacterized protein (DUF362 family)
MGNVVCLVKGNDEYETAKKVLDKLNFKVRNKKVFIKPNLTVATSKKSLSSNTWVLRAILERLDNCEVSIGDAGANTEKAFELKGYRKLSKEFNVKLVDLNKDTIVYKEVENPYYKKIIPIARSVLDAEYLIDVAKLKTHGLAKVTLCIKNLFGCVPTRKNRVMIHPFINKAIVDIMRIVKPDFNIVEGIIGNECDEVIANPVNSGIIIGGYDTLSVDFIGCKCMGIRPESVEHLRLAQELYGKREIRIIGNASIDDVMKPYKTEVGLFTKLRYLFEKGWNLLLG